MSGELLRIVVVDDHPLLREGVARSLVESGRFEIAGQGGSAAEAVRLVSEQAPDLVLLDLSMPGGGVEAAREIGAKWPEVKIVVLTVSEADEDVMAALRAGARGYVLKGVGAVTLIEILEGLAAGESYVSPSLAMRLLTEFRDRAQPSAADPISTLTQREIETLKLVAQGLSNKEVARKLDLQEKTVKHHMTRVLNKLQARNRTEAALMLRESAARGGKTTSRL